MDIATQLISGIDNLDRMNKEIRDVVTPVMKFVEGHPPHQLVVNGFASPSSPARFGNWYISVELIPGYYVLYWGQEIVFRACKGAGYYKPPTHMVQDIRQALPELILGVAERLPGLNAEMAPFLAAADK